VRVSPSAEVTAILPRKPNAQIRRRRLLIHVFPRHHAVERRDGEIIGPSASDNEVVSGPIREVQIQ
jgi:hypothetical protein